MPWLIQGEGTGATRLTDGVALQEIINKKLRDVKRTAEGYLLK